MLQSLLNTIFGCSHRRITFPLTPARKGHAGRPQSAVPGPTRNGTYVVCLDCGKEFAYDWSEMRLGEPVPKRAPSAEVQAIFR